MATPELTWIDFDASNIFPSEVDAVISQLDAAVTAVKTALEAVRAVFLVLQTFVVSRIDILEDALASIHDSIEAIIETLEEGGLRFLVWAPMGWRNVVSPSTWINGAVKSFTDLGDRNRPDFETTQGQAGFILMAIGADYSALLGGFKGLLDALFHGFDFRPIECIAVNTDEEGNTKFPPFKLDRTCLREGYPTSPHRGGGVAPDWGTDVLFRDFFPPFGDLARLLKKCLGLFVFGAGISDLMDQFIAFIEAKIAALEGLADEFANIVAVFDAIAILGGFHVLFFEGSFTTAELQAAILAAGLPEGLSDVDSSLMALGLVVHVAGDPTTEIASTVTLLRNIVGA
jgi:hypothetical protein